jgi:hypothetical protein
VANAGKKRNLQLARQLLHVPAPESSEQVEVETTEIAHKDAFICPKYQTPMVIIELLVRINYPRAPPEKLINPVDEMTSQKMIG